MFLLKIQLNTTKDLLLSHHLVTRLLQSRFTNDQQLVARGLSLVPAIMKDSGSSWKKHIMDLATVYGGDLPSADNMDMEIVLGDKVERSHW